MSIFPKVKAFILDLLFPTLCVGCEKEDSILCVSCEAGLSLVPPHCFRCHRLTPISVRALAGRTCKLCRRKSNIYSFFSPFLYKDQPIRKLIHLLKYGGARSVAPCLSEMLGRYLVKFCPVGFRKAMFIPIPADTRRLRARGFNHTELIGKVLLEKLKAQEFAMEWEFGAKVLRKARNTKPQVGLTSDERFLNIKGSFEAPMPFLIRGKDVILFDDVKTTGATLEEAAKTVKDAGAKRVWAVTVAH